MQCKTGVSFHEWKRGRSEQTVGLEYLADIVAIKEKEKVKIHALLIHALLSGFSLWCVYLNEVIYGMRMQG